MRLVEGHAEVDDLEAFLGDLDAVAEEHDCVVQAFDARLVAGEAHLEHAYATARRAIDRGEAIARDPAVEVLCYAAGRRQIEDALAMGVDEGRGPVVVLVAPDGADADVEAAAEAVGDVIEPDELERGTELGDPERLREYFDVGDVELGATDESLETLVRERVALLAVER